MGQRTDFDRLSIEVATDGSVTPRDAVALAANLSPEAANLYRDASAPDTDSDA